MIRMSVLYPTGDDITFEHDYYRETHVPTCIATWRCSAEIDSGMSGPYGAAVHSTFDTMEAMQAAMSVPEMGTIMADITNYTNAAPVMQVSEIV